jgi:phytoene/squalene synthetase
MTSNEIFNHVSQETSSLTTKAYSTSFSKSIALLSKELQEPIYAIYGFVRIADEIVDSFHEYDKTLLLKEFKVATYKSIERKISINPILQSFQLVVNKYNIDLNLIETFFKSMEMDLVPQDYNRGNYEEYIVGSAEVVGLMCLYVFTNGNIELYKKMEKYAVRLGATFQKINFLRDLKFDYEQLGRVYFPGINIEGFDNKNKQILEKEILTDFNEALKGIRLLSPEAQFGVYLAFSYYLALFSKIQSKDAKDILKERIRISNFSKLMLLPKVYFKYKFNMLNYSILL